MRTRTSTAGIAIKNRQSGFTYIILVIAVVVIGILAEAAQIMTSHVVRTEKEAELLFRGQAYRHAIAAYYHAGGYYPRNLEDLVNDPRYPHRHYIRRLYRDPMTGGHWRLLRAPGGGIRGVVSRGSGKPLKQGNFPPSLSGFADAGSYSDWVFEYTPPQLSHGGATSGMSTDSSAGSTSP